jgi:sigma-E factor negative regulatory protein RseC
VTTEKGIVLEVGDNTAWVKTEKSGACESCCAKGACLPIGGGNDMKVEAINTAGAASGDRVVLSFGSSSLFKATFFLYMFPILCLVGGAVSGMLLAPMFGVDEEAFSAIIAFACFLGSIIVIRVRGRKMSQKDEYKPKIIRVVRSI